MTASPENGWLPISSATLSMIAALRRTRATRRGRIARSSAVTLVGEAERLAALVILARAKLEPIPNAPPYYVSLKTTKVLKPLGNFDGVGFLLKMASFDTDHDGKLSASELERFRYEGDHLIETMVSSLSNYSVLFSLLLTIFVTLQVLHAGKEPYEQNNTRTHRLDYTAAGDAADYLLPRSAEQFRWCFYVLECSLLAVGTLICAVGLVISMLQYTLLANLPSLASKCEVIMSNLPRLTVLWTLMQVGLNVLLNAVVCILVRVSAVAFLCSATAYVLFITFITYEVTAGGVQATFRAQQTEARLLLAQTGDPVAVSVV